MGSIYIIVAIEYLMYAVKAPWWVMAVFGALMIADIVSYAVNECKENKDEKRNI